jgi:hypothetical protein
MNTVPGEVAAIAALELGNWRKAWRILSAGRLTDAYIGADLRTVARAMALREAGEHGRAWATLGVAAASVHWRWAIPIRPARGHEVVRLALPADPGEQAGAVFRTVRLIWREQGELSWLRHRAAEPPIGQTLDRHILILAFVEYLCWIECVRETWLQETPPDEASEWAEIRIHELRDRRREGFLRSATELRRLIVPAADDSPQAAGDMTKSVWGRAGLYFGLRRLAMEELANRQEPPWVDSAVPTGTPARKGAVLAWTMAQDS